MAQDVSRTPGLERLIDQYLPVPPDKIDAEFDRIWRETAGAGQDASSVRLHISNLVAWGAEEDAGPRFEGVMEELPQRHPCRAILAVLAADAVGTESAISARCWRGAGGGRQLCSEEILLRAAPGNDTALASALLALLVPELPVTIWLVGDPDPARRLPEELVEVANRAVVDSANGAVPAHALRSVATAATLGPPLEDLAWYRASVWHELIAQFFDAPAAADELSRLTRIDIAGGAGSVSTAALLTGGWLAAQLGLSVASVEAGSTMSVATFYAGARAVELRITPARDGAELALVSLASESATFTVQRHQASAHLELRTELGHEPVLRTVSPGFTHDAAMLALALDRTSGDDVFNRALEAALPLAGD